MPRKKRGSEESWKDEWNDEMKREMRYNRKNWKYYHYGHHGIFGAFWLAGWMFTVGLLKLTFWKAVIALFIWAYYLGSYLAGIWH